MIVTVLPAYNEAEALPPLLGRFQEIAGALDHRIIVVDDGSTDGTAQAVEAFRDAAVPVEIVRHPKNRGLGAAVDTGLRAALARTTDGDFIVTMDADDTHPPSHIPAMLERARAGHDLVIASRFEPGAEWHGKTWDRVLFSYGVSWLFRILFPIRGVRDYTCGYRLYRRELVHAAYDRWGDRFLAERSFACMLDILLKMSRLRPRVVEVPLVFHYDRKPGPSKMQVARMVRRTLVLLVRRRLGIFD